MRHSRAMRAAAILLVASFSFASIHRSLQAAAKIEAPGLGDPGTLQSISIETGRTRDGGFVIAGSDAGQQLVVTGEYSTGQLRDWTRKASYEATPDDVVSIDPSGYVTPLKEGRATIYTKAADGVDATIGVTVTNIISEIPVNFPNQIVPIFTKFGCNSGGCHGKSSGQNGFKLSLLGFEPAEDYEHLLKEGRGRRLFPAAPRRSLLLLKTTAELPHGGGRRVEDDSPSYRLLHRWVAQGMPYGNADDPTVTRIEVFPRQQSMERGGDQQIVVVAHYTDGSTEDVTRMTQFESNNTEMAEVSVTGVVTTTDLTGDVAVMTRYQANVDVFRAMVPLGLPVENLPEAANFIDDLVFNKLKTLGLPPSPVCDDATFLRRSSIDIAGRLPTLEESQRFLADDDPAKRAKWVDSLLAGTDYADYFANKWNAILRNKRRGETYKHGTYAMHAWIRESLHQNKPYDQFVRDIVAASGEIGQNPPVAWYREVKEQSQQVEDVAQLFLGLRLQCAKCHHHPFEKWSQRDYYGFAAFFSRVGRKNGLRPAEQRIFHKAGVALAKNPKTGQDVKPAGLGSPSPTLADTDDPRQALADWLADKENPFFAYALVNRYWKHFFGRGLVDPEDDMRVTNPATNPELLNGLGQSFIASGFDMKQLIRTICNSRVYQLTSEPNDYNQGDKQSFSRYYPKRLNAEVLLDAIDELTLSPTGFGGLPSGTRAVQLPDNGFSSYFLTVFGRPESSSACECERSSEANLAQSLHLLNSQDIQGKLTSDAGRSNKLAGDAQRSHEEKIRELYLVAFSRSPSDEEVSIAVAHVEKNKEPRRAYEDIIWALINTKEFLFNH